MGTVSFLIISVLHAVNPLICTHASRSRRTLDTSYVGRSFSSEVQFESAEVREF